MTNDTKIHPVVLCGGSGKQLWPVSRKSFPKQFTRLMGKESLLQSTLQRVKSLGLPDPLLVTGHDYRFIVGEQLAEINLSASVVIEPEARNSAASICAAAEILHAENPSALMLVLPTDHRIGNIKALAAAIEAGRASARDGEIVTFGIRPNHTETGYGYIELSHSLDDASGPQHFVQFIEKPDLAGAEAMLAADRYVWNSGIFLAAVTTIRSAFGRHAPALRAAVRRAIRDGVKDPDFFRMGDAFRTATDISFDYAVMEKEQGVVVPMDPAWADLGNWRTVWQESPRDADGVSTSGAALALDCQNTLLRAEDNAMQIVGVGLRNIAAIATRDGVLVADLDSAQSVAQAVDLMAANGIVQATEMSRQSMPWGHAETLTQGGRFQVRALVVKPGEAMTLQSHVHRAELWVVVEGSAFVTVGETETFVTESQFVQIPIGAPHRLSNPGRVDLRLIEVQTGSYLGDDAILRYESAYEGA